MNEKEPKFFYVKQHGNGLAAMPNADTLALNLNLQELLDLQDKYTTLQCECMRFADWVLNMSHDRCAIAIKFDNEYLDMAARELAANLRSKTAEEKEAERKKFSDAVNDAFNKTIGTELKK